MRKVIKADHWGEILPPWPAENFSPSELACRGTGKIKIDLDALQRLQRLRGRLGRPMIVNSAYRSPEHNEAVGGAPESKHMEGCAFDISMGNHDPEEFEVLAREAGFTGFGFYPKSDFMHIDTGPAREWGRRFPPRPSATPYPPERPIARESLAGSRTMVGGAAATIGTVGSAGVEAAAEAFGNAAGTLQPLIEHAEAIKLIFLGLTLAGVALTIWARISDHKRNVR